MDRSRAGTRYLMDIRSIVLPVRQLAFLGGCLLLVFAVGCATTAKKNEALTGVSSGQEKGPTATVETASPPREEEQMVQEIVNRRETVRMEKLRRLSDRSITFSIQDGSLRSAMISLVRGTSYNLSFGPGFTDSKVSAEFSGLTLGEALERLLQPAGLEYEVTDRVIVVDKPRLKTMIFRFDFPIAGRFQGGGVGGGGTGGSVGAGSANAVDVWENADSSVSMIVFGKSRRGGGGGGRSEATSQSDESGRRLIIDPSAGTLLVTAPEDILNEVEMYLRGFERSVKRQILIEAMLLQVSLSDQFLFGLNLDYQHPFEIGNATLGGILTPFAAPPVGGQAPNAPALTQRFSPDAGGFRIGLSNRNFAVLMDTLQQAGKVNIVSSPKIATLNNQQAVITVATEEVFFLSKPGTTVIGQSGIPVVTETTFTPSTFTVGVVLEVLPQVSDDDHVTLRIHPSVTSIVRTVTSPKGDTQPILDRKELTTIIRVQSGETIVIGGLIDEKTTKDRRGIPLLMDLPFIGNLFSKVSDVKEKREMMIFLTPKILEGPAIARLSDEERLRLEKQKDSETGGGKKP